MPSGRVHMAVELSLLPAWVGVGGLLGADREGLVAFALSYTVGSLFLSPDLDLARSDPVHRWGPLRFLWLPYSAVFRHRGLSHSLILGPVTRLLYLALVAFLLFLPVHLLAGVPWPVPPSPRLALPVLTGVYAAHLLHVGLDWLGSRIVRLL